MLLNHSKIKKVQEKPIVLIWLSDPTDLSDPLSQQEENQKVAEKQNELELGSRSDKSDRSDNNEESIIDEDVKLVNISGNRKGHPIEMTKEQYNSWEGKQNEKEEFNDEEGE
jgi:LAS superfamily LD-carboxypeptidase LdcB